MSRYLDFLNENAQFQNMLQFDTQEKEAYDQRKEEGILGLAQITPMVPDVIKKGREVYNKSIELYQKGQESLSKLETNLQRGRQALESGAQRLKAVGQKGVQLVDETLEKGGNLTKKIEQGINITKNEVQNLTKQYGERFTSELNSVKEKAINFGTDLVKQNREKVAQLKEDLIKKKEELGRDLTDEELKPFQDRKNAILQEREEFGKRFSEYRDNLEKDLKTKFTQKTQAETETRPKSEIEPAPKVEEKLPARRPTTLGKVGQEDSSFIRRRTQQMGRRVAQENFERDDIAEVMPEKRGFIDTVTGIFRGGEKAGRGAVKYSKEEMADMRAEFNRLSGGARSEMAEARFQELKGILNPKEAVQRVGAEASETLESGEQAVKGVAKGLQRTVQGGLQEGQQMASKTLQAGKQFASETAQGLKTAGSEALEQASTTAKTAVSRGAGLASEAGELAKDTGTKALGLGLEAKEAVGETVSTVGGIISESVPLLGEITGIGLGLYDIIKGFGDKPHIYNEAKPVFTAGL
jgi:hypothetical protein